VAGVSGHPVSLDDRNTFWGFSSHLFCYGAHTVRVALQKEGLPLFRRGIIQDTSGFFIPIKFASSPKEYFYLFGIYPLRLYLWILIYIQHYKKDYSNGRWEQIKSSKI